MRPSRPHTSGRFVLPVPARRPQLSDKAHDRRCTNQFSLGTVRQKPNLAAFSARSGRQPPCAPGCRAAWAHSSATGTAPSLATTRSGPEPGRGRGSTALSSARAGQRSAQVHAPATGAAIAHPASRRGCRCCSSSSGSSCRSTAGGRLHAASWLSAKQSASLRELPTCSEAAVDRDLHALRLGGIVHRIERARSGDGHLEAQQTVTTRAHARIHACTLPCCPEWIR
jgi:hypothetical protein